MTCFVTQIDGIAPPDVEEVPLLTTCVDENSAKIYSLLGEVERFFLGINIQDGQVSIKVPFSAIFDEKDIVFDETTSRQITIISGGRRRRLTSSIGVKQVLIVRVSSDQEPETSVTSSEEQLYTDFFTDENNLREVYRKCSNDKLILNPATGSSVHNGVLTIKPPENICAMGWKDVGNYAVAEIASLDWSADFKTIIMPDCVNFEGAAAWGETPGDTTWILSKYSSYPVTQVHEFGHNLSHRHSGKGTSEYGDDTGYMGNKASWTDAGSKMCFNGAKLWYFQWYSDFHRSVNPNTISYAGKLVGITDVQSGEIATDSENDVIIRLFGEAEQLFVIFNRSESFNSQVAEGDRVTITEQANEYSVSMLKASLGEGEEYITADGSVIKNCGISYGSPYVANVIIYKPGFTSAVCSDDFSSSFTTTTSSGTSVSASTSNSDINESSVSSDVNSICSDVPYWHDSDGPAFNCAWYGAKSDRCELFGSSYSNMGFTAQTACCKCKQK